MTVAHGTMPAIDVAFRVESKFGRLASGWDSGLTLSRSPDHPLQAMLRRWNVRYTAFVRTRFDRASKGDGTWKPLAPSTLLSRRHGKAGGIKAKTKREALRKARRKYASGKIDYARLQEIATEILSSATILRDTGVLFAALSPGAAGHLDEPVVNGIRVGFAAVSHGGKGRTIQEIAGYHNLGGSGGRPPQRAILVKPDAATVAGMMQDSSSAVRSMFSSTAFEVLGSGGGL